MFNETQRQALTDMVNIGVGQASASLNALIGHHVKLVTPEISILDMDQLEQAAPRIPAQNLAAVSMHFSGDLAGHVSLIFPPDAARILLTSITDHPMQYDELDEMQTGTLAEMGNILLNSVMESISHQLHGKLFYSIPDFEQSPMQALLHRTCGDADTFLLARTNFAIDHLPVTGFILLFFRIESVQALLESIKTELIP